MFSVNRLCVNVCGTVCTTWVTLKIENIFLFFTLHRQCNRRLDGDRFLNSNFELIVGLVDNMPSSSVWSHDVRTYHLYTAILCTHLLLIYLLRIICFSACSRPFGSFIWLVGGFFVVDVWIRVCILNSCYEMSHLSCMRHFADTFNNFIVHNFVLHVQMSEQKP